ncbi:MAG: pseudouridine synthase, partial [Blastocatellia bacterium]
IQGPIGRDPDRRPHWWIMESGRHAETRWRVLSRFDRATLVELEPVTGRTNQLRIHCAWKGHSIVGDELYDERHSGQRLEALESNVQHETVSETQAEARKQAEEGGRCEGWPESHAGPGRLFLHAWRLAFHHPETGEWMQLGSTLPAELLDHLNRFDRDSSERAARSLEMASSEQLVDRRPPEEK